MKKVKNITNVGYTNIEDRERIVLAISYGMRQNKRENSHRHNSFSSHAFKIGVYTGCIIACVIFSKHVIRVGSKMGKL